MPIDIALTASNLIALNPVPDGAYSVTMDVVNVNIPQGDGDQIQLGREQIDMIIDYAEHLALFKVGGAEWHATERQAKNFLIQCITYNQRLSASARASAIASMESYREKMERPRRLMTGSSLGALKT
jgi:hypothetical protein